MILIDADALMTELNDTKSAWQDYDAVEGAMRNIPAVDAVIPVRCAQCKHFKRNLENDTYCSSVNGLTDPEEDDFCSYGERRDDDGRNK